MAAAHALAQRVFESGVPTYGLTTGYGAQKRVAVTPEDVSRFNRSQIQDHRAGQGPPATDDVVRAAMLCLANLFAGGTTVVAARPGRAPRRGAGPTRTRTSPWLPLGSMGASDLPQMADLVHEVLAGEDLRAAKELGAVQHERVRHRQRRRLRWPTQSRLLGRGRRGRRPVAVGLRRQPHRARCIPRSSAPVPTPCLAFTLI